MPTTMDTVEAVTKEIYTGRITDQLQDEAVGWRRIQTTSKGITSEVGGRFVTFPLRVGRNAGMGYRNENEQLPSAGNQGFTRVQIGLKYGYGRVRLTGQTMELAQNNEQAFASAMSLEMNGLKDDLAKDQSRIFYGNTLGAIATVTAKGTNTVTVDSLQYVQDNEIVDIVTSAGTSHAAARNLTDIDDSDNTLTYDGTDAASSIAVGDILVRTGSYGREPNGLGSIIDDTGELFNVDPDDYRQWKSVINDNSGTNRPLSEGLMVRMVHDIRTKGGKVSLILTSLGVQRAYFNLLSQQRKYNDTTEFAGGFTGLTFNAGRPIPVVEDVDAPYNEMQFVQEDSLTIYRAADWSWLDMDGKIWKWLVDYDAWQAVLHCYYEIGCNRRNGNGKLKDITEG